MTTTRRPPKQKQEAKPMPPGLKAIAESIARSMREHPEWYADLKQTNENKKKK